jgi:hypothetical protein
VLSQVAPSEQTELERLREVLRRMPATYLDDTHRHAVRALRLDDRGERRGLSDEMIAAALAEADVERSVHVVDGHFQTDFAPASVSKGTGLRALAGALRAAPEAGHPFAFAAGDDSPDIPMLELAARAFAPANASRSLREWASGSPHVHIVRRREAAGLLEAVRSFLGHGPRRCRVCAPPQLSARTLLVTLPLGAADGPRRTRLRQAAALAAVLLRPRATVDTDR